MDTTLNMFAGIGRDEFKRVGRFFGEMRRAPGEILFREGDPGDCLHVVHVGKVSVQRGGHEIATIVKGRAFGEMSLLEGKPRSATCVALEPLTLLTLNATTLEAMLRVEPLVGARIYKAVAMSLASRFRRTSDRLAAHLWADA